MRFHELNLPVGNVFDMTMIGQDYKKYTFLARLLGYQKNAFVIVTPLEKPPQILLRAGQGVSVRCLTGSGVARFESQVEQLEESSSGVILLLDYPPTIQFLRKRQWLRVGVDAPVRVVATTELGMKSGSINGQLIDLCEVGAKLVTDKELTKIVTQMNLTFRLADDVIQHDLDINATISAALASDDGGGPFPFTYGVKFTNISVMDSFFLRAYCLHQIGNGNVLSVTE